ncbi:MAG: ATP-dependent helicase [Bradyrhizobium sp.]|uniref:UvrD-helicase domain-containing protein n=1 Tax=Bradyrhizobium sp. TaxID=376 RepID=UPI001DCFA5BF|nr:UvrD-helicase domain-containing protein [Bradyrhizobium sp.]MBV9561157.1 ATP-dependent helicase [Bradyrhizobium sp.]
MTIRVNQPDTPADEQLRQCLDHAPTNSFIMKAGAGSGKTTSLVKALAHLARLRGPRLRQKGQQIACITYTEVAVGEIWGDVSNAPLFHVSTIHSFLWNIVRPFTNDIREWVRERINEKIGDSKERLAKPRTQAATKLRLEADLLRYDQQLETIKTVKHFTYGIGSNYSEGVLGHDDVLRIGPALINESILMRRLVADRFPYLFVDESQDTDPKVVEAFRNIAVEHAGRFCLGFFGDPMQKIYLAGVGAIEKEGGWESITKPENFRCPRLVLDVVNKIRAKGDGLEQTRGKMIEVNGEFVSAPGTARIFVLPADNTRSGNLNRVRQWLSERNDDQKWLDDSIEGVKVMVLVHRMAAQNMGFPDIYAALNDHGSSTLKDGLLDGSAWVLRPFMHYVLPIVRAIRTSENFAALRLLRTTAPALQADNLKPDTARQILDKLKADLDNLVALFDNPNTTTRDVLTLLNSRNLYPIDERLKSRLEGLPPAAPAGEGADDDAAVIAFFACKASQMWNYENYVLRQSPFDTHQGVKGAEFDRVIVVLDDEEAKYNLFSYGKFFGITPLSDTDKANSAAGNETVLDRTTRLFYVCCSRAVRDLAVVFYVPEDQVVTAVEKAKEFFRAQDIFTAADLS